MWVLIQGRPHLTESTLYLPHGSWKYHKRMYMIGIQYNYYNIIPCLESQGILKRLCLDDLIFYLSTSHPFENIHDAYMTQLYYL